MDEYCSDESHTTRVLMKGPPPKATNLHKTNSSATYRQPHEKCMPLVGASLELIHGSPVRQRRESVKLNGGTRKKEAVVKHAMFMVASESNDFLESVSRYNSAEEIKPVRPPQLDINELIDRKVKQFKSNEFIYLTYTVSKKNEHFTPYSLAEVPYQQVDKSNFYTISRRGVTYFSSSENFFTPLEVWQTEYSKYCKLIKLNTFANYRRWKGFKMWQKAIQWRKYSDTKSFLEQNLILATPPLAKVVLKMRKEYCRIIEMNFFDAELSDAVKLSEFMDIQMRKYVEIREYLQKYRTGMTDILYEACYTAIISRGFQPMDEALIYKTAKKLREMMSFTDRAKKRRFCIFLTSFLTYCDYMTIGFLHILLKNTFESFAQISQQEKPIFITELILTPAEVLIEPSREQTISKIRELCDSIESAIYEMPRFQNDERYLQFTRPCIMGRQEGFLGGSAPDVRFVTENDEHISNSYNFIFESINNAYKEADIYISEFGEIQQNFKEDFNTNPETIKSEQSVDKLRGYCERYNREIKSLADILPEINLGMLKLIQETFSREVIPVCQTLLTVLDTYLPKVAIEVVARLMDQSQNVMAKLMTMPEATLDYVLYMRYLDESNEIIQKLIAEIDYAFQLFTLMKDYSILVEEVEKENFMDCEDLILNCKEVLAKKLTEKCELVGKFAKSLQQDIAKIFTEVQEVQDEITKEWLIDENSNKADVKEMLTNLMDRLIACQALAHEYRNYQKGLSAHKICHDLCKIEVTRYDALEAALKEVKLRQTLWESTEEWDEAINVWHKLSFSDLDMDKLIEVNSKILKNCILLEKNLPPNKIVPKLKESAQIFKDKIPILGYLRNPTLKQRHWLKIESIINRKVFQDDSVTLSTFEETGVFSGSMTDDIMEVAGQASAEQGLEMILKKVENSWKELELSVVQHRDTKDVYILAGLEELQLILDESFVNINTIAASRHVGPVKSRVEEWQKKLELFSEILDDWTTCQTNWIYLEAIFSAADIQRQLPHESRMLSVVDKNWKDLLRRTAKMPLALAAMTDPNTLALMKENNLLLEQIIRCLEAYLEVKRVAFPRFYFLSNDELLEILAQTRNPLAIQPHLPKCFDAIAKLEFGTKETGGENKEKIITNDIVAMISPEGERITFGMGLTARGPVEEWLAKVEAAMFIAIKRCIKFAYKCYPIKDRSLWLQDHCNQSVLIVSQLQWAANVHEIFESNDVKGKIENFEKKLFKDLQTLAKIARSDISKLLRRVLCALITIDVHARDTITNMIRLGVDRSNDFNWLKMLRYYWLPASETVEAKMSSTTLPYFYEYLGAGGVLVITPLTDRCYLCLMGALQMDLGGAPAGPAGTGKTETTKDLAKALAKQCIVFNCSEGLDYKMMGRFFSGLAQSGAWCCFDEFNRIDIEVLSVIAQQLITIKNAKSSRMNRFLFEGHEIRLNMSCAAFITMNPGYAGRTELPDNLKALFRPIAMMVPDYALIAEVILYSEGFESSKSLARKMVQMYKLCSEQLSQQDHYDFGMRAVKSVLVMAGALKRAAPDQSEDVTLITALRDSNLPKFLADDTILFNGILGDLFPNIQLPMANYGHLDQAIVDCMNAKKLQPNPQLIAKCIQLYETMCVRWGVMLVGPTGGGKTSILHTVATALTKIYEEATIEGPQYRPVRIQTLNPKAVSLDELYGAVNSMTLEWKDGLLGLSVRKAVARSSGSKEQHEWIVCDGPVDAAWIENLNTVLDDNKMLCLANSERIKLTPWVHMIFEVQDLSQASPATVSRCGMVYVDPSELGWICLAKSWFSTVTGMIPADLLEFLMELFEKYLQNCFEYVRKYCQFVIHQVDNSKVQMMCTLIGRLLLESEGINKRTDAKNLILKIFLWTMLWSVGGNLVDSSKILLDVFIRDSVKEESDLPSNSDLWNFKINLKSNEWQPWSSIVEKFSYKSDVPYFDILVPTTDTEKFGFVANLLFSQRHPVMFTGETGVGKSVLARSTMKRLSDCNNITVNMNFSAQTNSFRIQEIIESRLEKRKKTVLGAPIGKRVIFFIDDVNMPKLDTYGSQAPIELLRQYLDFKGLYDREKMFWKTIDDVILGCACAPPGGGRNPLTPRFVRHFAVLLLPSPNDDTLRSIFSAIINGFFDAFNKTIQQLAAPIVRAAVAVYYRIAKELLPTPTKSHYVFNLRDLSKLMQGILQADSSNYTQTSQMLRLFYHESMRVFHDRLVNDEDKGFFGDLMNEICLKFFENPIVTNGEATLLFGDFILFGQAKSERIYEEIKDVEKLKDVLADYLDDYNTVTGSDVSLIFFRDAVEHVVRLARLLRAERANGLLVGLSGMGKQSLSRLAAHINGYKCVQIKLFRGYDQSAFHEDLRKLYWIAGVQNTPTVFLLSDNQIIREEFLEDINNMLNSGEVPNLFVNDEYEKVILGARDECVKAKQPDTSRDGIFDFFINRVRANLHIVLCMSPVGDNFRRRCRMFPSLVNCSTIDWFVKWPPEALYSVALGSLKDVAEDEGQNVGLAKICVKIHETVEAASDRLFKEFRRHYYTTPSSYLELLKLYHSLRKIRSNVIVAKKTRIATGLNKILETNDVVAVMQKELTVLAPQLEVQSIEMKKLLIKMSEENKVAETFKAQVLQDEAEAKDKEIISRAIADEAHRDLEVATPALKAAQDALKAINKNDINELKSFASPPALVQFVMEAVCILLGVKPNWESAKKLMADVNFLKRLMEFDKEHIPEITLKKIKTYVEHKDFDPAKIEKVSKVAKSVSIWVTAMDKFAKIFKIVEPKIKKSREAEKELKEIMAILKQKQSELAETEAHLQILKDNIDEKNREFKVIQDNVDLTTSRLQRAGRLTSALADEEVRWAEIVKELTDELRAVPGDVLVASAYVAYVGAFPFSYRHELIDIWVKECQHYAIPSSKIFNFIAVLGDAYEIREWNMHNLPRNDLSVENAIVVKNVLRWPLMIDPQEQANRWIRSMETKNSLKITKMTDPHLMRTLELCIRQGHPLLIEDIEEQVDPMLSPILKREQYNQAGRMLIRLGDTEIDYDANFKLYMTSKLTNPHYLPEICITVTLVNFLVTKDGLEDQLLADVVAIELPELEKQRSDLIVRINSNKQQLVQLEDNILKLLFASEGNILDDEELVETLNEAKETSAIIAARLVDTEETEAVITITREKYRILAARGATLYFVVATMAEIDPMYQYSLKYFTSIFCSVISLAHEKVALEQRLAQLMADEVYALYANVSRGLFEKHKLIFSFLLSIAIEMHEQRVTRYEYGFVLRGPSGTKIDLVKPNHLEISESVWISCAYLQQEFVEFSEIFAALDRPITIEFGDFKETFVFGKTNEKSENWPSNLPVFKKLMLIAAFSPDKLVLAITAFVNVTLGRRFTDVGKSSLLNLYSDTSNTIPLIFILSTGSDPMASFLRFTQEMDYSSKFHSISLGQGQGPAAEALIDHGRTAGQWIFLQNCHLATSWMEKLERIVRNLALGNLSVHSDFRLYLSSMPTDRFPISVLQNSVKVTNEPPKGLKANLLRAFDDLNRDFFEHHALRHKWRQMIFGLSLFHGVLLERRRFGPLGWNILYEFNESDRECGLNVLDIYCDRQRVEEIPWAALEYINGEVTWGGRVTDYWDQRCLQTILLKFSSPEILEPNHSYTLDGLYRCPDAKSLSDFRKYSEMLPSSDSPEIFGMHENANLVFRRQESGFFVKTILASQTSGDLSTDDGGIDDIVLDKIKLINDSLALKINCDNFFEDLLRLDNKGRVPSLTTVLLQETERYNKLLAVVHSTLSSLSKAIRGFVVMSESLEEMFNSILNNYVPDIWSAAGFLSTKSLANWIIDFQHRIDYIQSWIMRGLPLSSWISGLFFPQSFITGCLQTYARHNNIPIDSLHMDFEILNETIVQSEIYEMHQAGDDKEFKNLVRPESGIIIHGLFIEAGRWDAAEGGLCDAQYGELVANLPAIWLKPCVKLDIGSRYEAPLYKTQIRAGVLSTTGHSTNFVLSILLPSNRPSSFWILRGTALVTALTE